MGRVSQTNQVMWVMEQLPTVEAKLEYQRRLPKGIGARVLNRILDNALAERVMEQYCKNMTRGLAKLAEIEKREYDSWEHFHSAAFLY